MVRQELQLDKAKRNLLSVSIKSFSHFASDTYLYCSICNSTRTDRLHPDESSNVGLAAFLAWTPLTFWRSLHWCLIFLVGVINHILGISWTWGGEDVLKCLQDDQIYHWQKSNQISPERAFYSWRGPWLDCWDHTSHSCKESGASNQQSQDIPGENYVC